MIAPRQRPARRGRIAEQQLEQRRVDQSIQVERARVIDSERELFRKAVMALQGCEPQRLRYLDPVLVDRARKWLCEHQPKALPQSVAPRRRGRPMKVDRALLLDMVENGCNLEEVAQLFELPTYCINSDGRIESGKSRLSSPVHAARDWRLAMAYAAKLSTPSRPHVALASACKKYGLAASTGRQIISLHLREHAADIAAEYGARRKGSEERLPLSVDEALRKVAEDWGYVINSQNSKVTAGELPGVSQLKRLLIDRGYAEVKASKLKNIRRDRRR